jgi:hypothetical protein
VRRSGDSALYIREEARSEARRYLEIDKVRPDGGSSALGSLLREERLRRLEKAIEDLSPRHRVLLEEEGRASERFSESRYAGFPLRMARKTARSRLEGLSKEEVMDVRRGMRCWALVGAVVGLLGFAAVAADPLFRDDFCDGDVFDCIPICWSKAPWSQGEFTPLLPPECGMAVRAMGDLEMTLEVRPDVFSGQVRVRVTGTFNGTRVAPNSSGYYPYIGPWLHADSSTLSGYNGELFATGDVWIEKWAHGPSSTFKGKAGFVPMEEADLEVAVELQAVEIPPALPGGESGQRIELRAWRPEKEPRPAAAQVAIEDRTLQMGTVGLGACTTIGAERPLIIRSFEVEEIETPPTFRRGDANADGTLDLSDGIDLLGYLFLGSEAPSCLDAADSNDSGTLDISDPIRLFFHLFLTGSDLPVPGPASCGPDPTGDDLGCESFSSCDD